MIKISLTDQMALRQYLSVSFMILVVVNRLCVCVLDQPGESAQKARLELNSS